MVRREPGGCGLVLCWEGGGGIMVSIRCDPVHLDTLFITCRDINFASAQETVLDIPALQEDAGIFQVMPIPVDLR